jgi:hypothetical protein
MTAEDIMQTVDAIVDAEGHLQLLSPILKPAELY